MPSAMSQLKRTAKVLFRLCLKDGELDEVRAREAVKFILRRRRRGYFAVLNEFKRLLKLETARHTAKVESAISLGSDLEARLRTNLEQRYGAGVSAEFVENPQLIAGLRIRIANDVYDSSVRSRLATLASGFGIKSY